jgi:hypothetical protein
VVRTARRSEEADLAERLAVAAEHPAAQDRPPLHEDVGDSRFAGRQLQVEGRRLEVAGRLDVQPIETGLEVIDQERAVGPGAGGAGRPVARADTIAGEGAARTGVGELPPPDVGAGDRAPRHRVEHPSGDAGGRLENDVDRPAAAARDHAVGEEARTAELDEGVAR